MGNILSELPTLLPVWRKAPPRSWVEGGLGPAGLAAFPVRGRRPQHSFSLESYSGVEVWRLGIASQPRGPVPEGSAPFCP